MGSVTLVAEPVAKTGRREWPVECRNQEAQVSGRARRNARLKLRVQRDVYINGRAMFVLRLPKANPTITDVLRSKSHGIFAAAPCIDKKIKGQARPAPEWIHFAKSCDFLWCP